MTSVRIADISAELHALLGEGVPAILLTVDESGFPHTAFSFAVVTESHQIAFAVDEGSRTLGNLERNGKASIQILAPGNVVYLLKGRVHISPNTLISCPVPSRRAEMEVISVKNQTWSGVAVAPLEYRYSAALEKQWRDALPLLFAELRKDTGSLHRSDPSADLSNQST